MAKDFKQILRDAEKLAKAQEKDTTWVAADILTDPDKAAESMLLLVKSDKLTPFLISPKARAKVIETEGEVKSIRTDLDTYKRMSTIRNTLKKFAKSEANDQYADFWSEMLAINDAYFIKAFMDAFEIDPSIVATINELRKK